MREWVGFAKTEAEFAYAEIALEVRAEHAIPQRENDAKVAVLMLAMRTMVQMMNVWTKGP